MVEIKNKVEYRKIKDLCELEGNPRTINKEQFERLKKSIKDNPDYFEARPIILSNRTGKLVILAGNQRYKAARALGIDEVPTVLLPNLSEKREREIIIRDNVENGEWDMDLLAKDWDTDDLQGWGVDVPQFYDEENIVEDDVDEIEVPKLEDAVSEIGKVYKVGKHRVACGDSLDDELIDRLFGKERAKVIFSSPPYNMGKGQMYDKYEDDRSAQDYIDFNLNIIDKWGSHHDGFLFWNTKNNSNNNSYYLDLLCDIKNKTKYKMIELIHWDKTTSIPVGINSKNLKRNAENIMLLDDDTPRDIQLVSYFDDGKGEISDKKTKNYISNYWAIAHESGSVATELNTATYPVRLPARGISFTTKKGDIVADPFLGTGTTLIACEQMGRRCFGCELDERQVDIIRKRYWKLTTGSEDGWVEGTPCV